MKDPAWAGRQINPVKATVAVTEKEMQERNGEHFMGRGEFQGENNFPEKRTRFKITIEFLLNRNSIIP